MTNLPDCIIMPIQQEQRPLIILEEKESENKGLSPHTGSKGHSI
jgi:hypothetical protein